MIPNRVRLTALLTITVLSLLNTIQLARAGAPANACALISQAQIAAALGFEVDAGKNIIGADDCRWIQKGAAAGSDGALLQINLTKAQSFETGKTPLPNWTKTPVAGLGDDAYSADRGGKITFPISPSLSVKKGSVFIVIITKVPKATLEQTKDIEKKVASAILEKL
jgi:hypothetical protein